MSNPFLPPESGGAGSSSSSGHSDVVLTHLSAMRSWQNLIGWTLTITGGLAFVGVLLMFMVATTSRNAGGVLCIAPVYVIMGIIYVLLGGHLRSSAAHIRRAVEGEDGETELNIELSLRSQSEFWNLSGMVTAGVLVLYAVMLIFVCFGILDRM